MAKKRKPSTKKAPAAPRRRKVTARAPGPVTLAEATALARAARPRIVAAKAVVEESAQLQRLGVERRRLARERRHERARRLREYTAIMTVMRRRGARRPPPRTGAGKAAARAERFEPLRIFAEGDSWFDYPPFPFRGGVVPRLQRRLGVPILNLAEAGDEVRSMLGVKQRKILAARLVQGCPTGGPWDALLFSGGGNDMVGDPLVLWVEDWDPTVPPERHLNRRRFEAALALVRAGYEDLIALRDALSPDTHLFFHGYDFAIPDGRGYLCLGPWLEPSLALRGFPNLAARTALVRAMLEEFAAMLAAVAGRHAKATFIGTQHTLKPVPASWHNELHPAQEGFDAIAEVFQRAVKAVFPDRVV